MQEYYCIIEQLTRIFKKGLQKIKLTVIILEADFVIVHFTRNISWLPDSQSYIQMSCFNNTILLSQGYKLHLCMFRVKFTFLKVSEIPVVHRKSTELPNETRKHHITNLKQSRIY